MESREIVVDGLRAPVIEAGPAEAAEAVVFVHGNPGSSRDWQDLVGRVGEFARAVALDMPGFGKADKPKDFDYTVDGYGRFLASALDELGIERAHLVLHDFGGGWGLAWATSNPDRLASATLIDTGVFIDYRWHALARIWRTPVVGELFQVTTTRPGFRLLISRGNPRGLPREFVDEMYDNLDRGTRRAILRLYRATPESLLAAPTAALRELDRPALVIWGAADPYIGVEQAERQREAFPSAEVVVFEQSGHWPFIDDPEGVAARVVPFLREQMGATAPA